jgi:hypothetical protein
MNQSAGNMQNKSAYSNNQKYNRNKLNCTHLLPLLFNQNEVVRPGKIRVIFLLVRKFNRFE